MSDTPSPASTPSAWWQPGQLLFVGFEGTTLPRDLARLIGQGRIGGVILFTRNFVPARSDGVEEGAVGGRAAPDPKAVRALVRSIHEAAPADAPVLVAVDQEGGRVQRLRSPWTQWPAMRHLADLADDPSTSAFADALATELLDAGIGLDFTPCVDVDTNPDNPVIGDRSFGRTAEIVIRHARIVIERMQAAGLATCAKHFPGHGDTAQDSHHTLPRLPHDLDRLREVELPPFRAAIDAGVASIMTAHVMFDALDRRRPATLSPDVMNVLREELGYDGVVFTDDLEMKAIAEHHGPQQIVDGALEAGVDGLLVCRAANLRDEVLRRLEQVPDGKVERAISRVIALKQRFAFAARDALLPDDAAVPPYAEHLALAERLRLG